MLERLGFSVPISVTINAPLDVVWGALTDVGSYPSMLSGVTAVSPIADRSSNFRSPEMGGSGVSNNKPPSVSRRSSDNISADSQNRPTKIKGSTWKITRKSVLENQRYSAKVTVTQYDDEAEKRSFTMSTHQMLGATCSLKFLVESVATVPLDSSLNHRQKSQDNDKSQGDAKSTSNTTASARATPACRVTARMTMVPYQFFVKLVGIMCCLCLLKYRARMAMECDLEDLAVFCEGRAGADSGQGASDRPEEGRRRSQSGSNVAKEIEAGEIEVQE